MMIQTPAYPALFTLVTSAALLAGCGGDDPVDHEKAALLAVKEYVATNLTALNGAAVALQSAAPTPDADGWSATTDAAAVERMKAEWKNARNAYERIEGAIAVLFPNLDVATDERYDGFLEEGPDEAPFDDEGVIGVHAIERILWADRHPAEVVAFESALPGYQAAAFPANEAEATAFRDALVARLVRDTKTMADDFAPLALDPASAYRGVIGSMEEQLEKVALASTGESESRYADHTLADMRANLAGGREIYRAFQPWLLSKDGGAALDGSILGAFGVIEAEYSRLAGDGIPAVPATWSTESPSADDLATDYGRVWSLLSSQSDPENPESLVARMNAGGELLGIPSLP